MANKLLPFRRGTRQRRQLITSSLAYAANSTVTVEFPRVGYLARVFVQFAGTVTLSAAGALTDLGPWNVAQRFRISTNIGSSQIVDVSGFGAFLYQRRQNEGQDFSQAGLGQTTPSTDLHAAPVAMGANTWQLSWVLPVSANIAREFEFGLVNLQSEQTRVTLDIVTGALTDPASNVTGIAATWSVWYEYYEVPDPTKYAQPPLALCRLIEEQMPIGQTGDNIYTFPRQGTLMHDMTYVRANGARSDGIDTISTRINKTDILYRHDRKLNRMLDRSMDLLNPITGVFATELWYADGLVGQGDGRDFIDLEELSTVEKIITVNSGTTLGSNNNFANIVRRIGQRLTK